MERFKVLLFDCYGTLIDWERGMYENLGPLLAQKTCPDPDVIVPALVNEQHTFQNGDKTLPYPIVLEQAYRQVVAKYRLHYDSEAAQALGQSVGSWPAFEDSAECLSRLKALGFKLAILANVDNHSFKETRRQLEPDGRVFDEVYTAQDIGSYKPDLRNFRHVLEDLEDRYDISIDEVLCIAQSKLADVEPANKIGIATVWINRDNRLTGHNSVGLAKPDFKFDSLEEFTEALERLREES